MLVFELPSFPYVFKVIKDWYPPPKDTTRAQVKEKYLLVKHHDRVGRMADTLEYSDVAFPLSRFSEELLAELQRFAPSLVEIEGDRIVIKHLYIERRMTPLNIFLQDAARRGPARARRARIRQCDPRPGRREHLPRRHAVQEFRRHAPRPRRVLRLRRNRIPHRLQFPRHPGRRATRKTRWRPSPGTRSAGTTSSPNSSAISCSGTAHPPAFHAAPCRLLTRAWWQSHKERILAGDVEDVFPYPQHIRFREQPDHHPGGDTAVAIPLSGDLAQ
jgi:isocitrate dehydrogenase kinase/phosphatase